MVARNRFKKTTGERSPNDRYANFVSPTITNWLGARSARTVCTAAEHAAKANANKIPIRIPF